jgi:hypothetical protein
VANPSLYLDPNSVPEGFILRDPSHMRAENINQLWAHWDTKKAAKKKLVVFTAAKLGDMSKERLENADPYQEKSDNKYVEIKPVKTSSSKGAASTPRTTRTADSDSTESESARAAFTGCRTRPAESDSSEDESVAAASTGRRAGPAARPFSAPLGAPATVPIKDRILFMKSLSSNHEYQLLVEGIRDLGKVRCQLIKQRFVLTQPRNQVLTSKKNGLPGQLGPGKGLTFPVMCTR